MSLVWRLAIKEEPRITDPGTGIAKKMLPSSISDVQVIGKNSTQEKVSEPISSQESTDHVGSATESDSTSPVDLIQQSSLDYWPSLEKFGYISHPERKRLGTHRENPLKVLDLVANKLFGGSGEVE